MKLTERQKEAKNNAIKTFKAKKEKQKQLLAELKIKKKLRNNTKRLKSWDFRLGNNQQ